MPRGGERVERRTSRFTDEQIVVILQEVERTGKSGEVIRRHRISGEMFSR